MFPFLEKIYAAGVYGNEKLRKAMAGAAWSVEVVKRSDHAKGFEVLPKRRAAPAGVPRMGDAGSPGRPV